MWSSPVLITITNLLHVASRIWSCTWSWTVVITPTSCRYLNLLVISFKMIFIWNEKANGEIAITTFDVWAGLKNSKKWTQKKKFSRSVTFLPCNVQSICFEIQRTFPLDIARIFKRFKAVFKKLSTDFRSHLEHFLLSRSRVC